MNDWQKGTPPEPGQYLTCEIMDYWTGKKWLERKTLVWNPYNECWDTEDGDDFHCRPEKIYCWMELPDPPEYNN